MSLSRRAQDGELYTRQGLDREQRAQYVLTVMLEEKRATSKIVSTWLPSPRVSRLSLSLSSSDCE